jgi:hypothetical protein
LEAEVSTVAADSTEEAADSMVAGTAN